MSFTRYRTRQRIKRSIGIYHRISKKRHDTIKHGQRQKRTFQFQKHQTGNIHLEPVVYRVSSPSPDNLNSSGHNFVFSHANRHDHVTRHHCHGIRITRFNLLFQNKPGSHESAATVKFHGYSLSVAGRDDQRSVPRECKQNTIA